MLRIKINGIVQGVGFRPFVYKTAIELGLKGYVLNSTSGVEIGACGAKKNLELFVERIKKEHPPAAYIKEFYIEKKEDVPYNEFTIQRSQNRKGSTQISPDLAVCEDCAKELFDESNPRFNYAFINCTNCGPRYSIIENTPYDRPVTSMKEFEMCNYCKVEYTDPLNRRFHAQPIACPTCGPQLKFLDKNFEEITSDPIVNTIKFLKEGKIIGIKGIGGFHIACDATNKKIVADLRNRKNRPHKPFAVMCYHEKLNDIVQVNDKQFELLKSPAAPIIILPKKENNPIQNNVAPQNPNIGVFLPYAPVHHQILSNELPYLIMTSGNLLDEPIATDEKKLTDLCDFFLTHNRPILNRNDDSVIRPSRKQNIFLRRSRGYVPNPIKMPFSTVPTLGTGAELKLSFSLTKGDSLYLAPYIGNNDSKETFDFYTETLDKFKDWFKIEPELIACDLQPDFMTTRFAESSDLPLIKVQHHHAHIAAVMAEHHLDEPVIGISYDGTGYGTDGAIWGGEIILADYAGFKRFYHLNYMPLPGGDVAIRHPVRIAYSYLLKAGENPDLLKAISSTEKKVISKQIENNFNVFQTSSMGRLFDCVSAMLGLFPNITFEAQSAMALEFLCGRVTTINEKPYPFQLEDKNINILPLVKAIAIDIIKKESKEFIARRFHRTVIDFSLKAVKNVSRETGIRKVVLCGGVMQNGIILDDLTEALGKNNFTVFSSSILPSNDGAISVGQVMIANRKL